MNIAKFAKYLLALGAVTGTIINTLNSPAPAGASVLDVLMYAGTAIMAAISGYIHGRR